MIVRIISKEIIKDEFSRLIKMTRPAVQVWKSGAWVTVKEFLNYFEDEAQKEAKKLYDLLLNKKEQNE